MPVMNLPGPKAKAIIQTRPCRHFPFLPTWLSFCDGSRPRHRSLGCRRQPFSGFCRRHCGGFHRSQPPQGSQSHPGTSRKIYPYLLRLLPLEVGRAGRETERDRAFHGQAVCFMTNSGTESVEAAIKLARYHTGRTQFIGFLGGFHGRTMGAVTFTASKPVYHRGFYPLMNGVTHVPFPDPYRPILGCRPGEDYGEAVVRYIEDEIFGKLCRPKTWRHPGRAHPGRGRLCHPDAGLFPGAAPTVRPARHPADCR